MTSAYKESLINKIALLIKENYVLRDKRGTMIDGLNQLFHNGRYQDITEYRKMADTLTEDLQSISHDKHFAVFVSPPTAADGPKEKNQKEPDQEELDKIEKAKYESQRKYNFGFHKVEIMDGNIGYLDLRRFSGLTQAEATAHGAMAFLSHADAIIIDLRMNRGGAALMVKLLASYFFGDKAVHLDDLYNGITGETQESWTDPSLPRKRMPTIDLYLLTSKDTFSGAEAFAYDLQQLQRAIIVGEPTGGGAHMCTPMPINDEFRMMMPFAGAVHPMTKSNWEGAGVQPHYVVKAEDALETALSLISIKRGTIQS